MEKKTGVKNIAKRVDVIIPPQTAVPSDRRLAAAAPVAKTSGRTPRMKAIDVIKIGRNRIFEALTDAAKMECPDFLSSLANSTIKMAFLLAKAMTNTIPICT